MENDDKTLTEDKLKSLLPADPLGDQNPENGGAAAEAVAKLDTLDVHDNLDSFSSGETASVSSISARPGSAKSTPTNPEIPLKTAESTKAGSMSPTRAEEIKEWRAKRQADLTKQRHASRSAYVAKIKPSARREWQFTADALKPIEIPKWAIESITAAADLTTSSGAPDLSLAPGCFGLAMTFKPDAKECVSCPFHEQCKPLAAQALITLHTETTNNAELQEEIVERRTHDRARNRKDKAKSRAKLNAKKAPPKQHPIASAPLTLATLADRKAKLIEWLDRNEPRSRQLRKHKKEILLDYAVFQNERRRICRAPGPTAFARALTKQAGKTISVSSAQKRLARLCRLEGAEGPWG